MSLDCSSRICVKNLPKYLTDERLREHFSAIGEVTDAKIIRTRDGRSRQFGFVGYRTAKDAQAAVKYFNRSFVDTCRMSCEIAQPIGDSNLSRPWSRHSQGSSAYTKLHNVPNGEEGGVAGIKETNGKSSAGGASGNEQDDDPQLLEFLQVMQRRNKTKLWADDTLLPNDQAVKRIERGNSKHEADVSASSFGHGSKGLQFDGDSEKEHAKGPSVFRIVEDIPGLETIDTSDLVRDEAISDSVYMKSRINSNWSDDEVEVDMATDEEAGGEDAEDGYTVEDIKEQETMGNYDAQNEDKTSSEGHVQEIIQTSQGGMTEVVAQEQESVSETGRLFVRNLSYTTSEGDLMELFTKYGELSQVHLVLDKETKCSKGYAYVLFMLPEAAMNAMEKLDGAIFQGRLLHILPAKRPPSAPGRELNTGTGELGMSKVKQQREAQRRATEASGNTRAWNSLFMHPDTIAENVARKYGLSKSDFLDPDAEDLAVRMALGETHIIAETKKALFQEGVNIEILEKLVLGKLDTVKRSNHVILVKNLPFATMNTDLVTMFGKFGSLERVILPPTRTLALIVYLEAAEARSAFKGLAYKRFKHVPLYLEWAPENILSQNSSVEPREMTSNVIVGEDQIKHAVFEQEIMGTHDEDIEDDNSKSRSVFIKNLNFSTTQSDLKKHFQQHLKEGTLCSVKIKMKPAKDGNQLSMGFGFVELDSPETARNVCKQLQGTIVDGHALVLQLCHGRKAEHVGMPSSKKAKKNESSTKLIVRNVAFEAIKKDLRQLFSPFGQIKTLRLPKKFDGNHRGFAFVEFVTKQEAENAYNSLSSTHLYGRHLVLERARENESLEELRMRTAMQFSEEDPGVYGNVRHSRKRKNSSLIDDANSHFGQITE